MNARRGVLAGAALASCLAAGAGAQTPATERQAAWRLDSPLTTSRGHALWLDDGVGSWRLEIGVAADDAAGIDDLYVRYGDGWTLAGAGSPPVLLQPWGSPWREMGTDFGQAVTAILAQWGGAAAAVGPPAGPWRAVRSPDADRGQTLVVGDLPEDWNPGAGAGAEPDGLRRELTARGLGRGGPGLRLRLTPLADGGLTLTSARWPGRVDLGPPTVTRRPAVPPEAFLPIWSLAEVGLTPLAP